MFFCWRWFSLFICCWAPNYFRRSNGRPNEKSSTKFSKTKEIFSRNFPASKVEQISAKFDKKINPDFRLFFRLENDFETLIVALLEANKHGVDARTNFSTWENSFVSTENRKKNPFQNRQLVFRSIVFLRGHRRHNDRVRRLHRSATNFSLDFSRLVTVTSVRCRVKTFSSRFFLGKFPFLFFFRFSDLGRIICIFYAIVGIPMTLLLLSVVVRKLLIALNQSFICFREKLRSDRRSDGKLRFAHLSIVVLVVFVLLFVVPSVVFTHLEEGWSFVDAFYFCFISLTTIGLGDLVAGDSPEQRHRLFYKMCLTSKTLGKYWRSQRKSWSFASAYLLVGVAIMMTVVALVSQLPEFHLVHYFLSEQEVEEEHERLSHGDRTAFLWLSHSTSIHSYGIRNSTSSQPYRRQNSDKEDLFKGIDVITSWENLIESFLVSNIFFSFFGWLFMESIFQYSQNIESTNSQRHFCVFRFFESFPIFSISKFDVQFVASHSRLCCVFILRRLAFLSAQSSSRERTTNQFESSYRRFCTTTWILSHRFEIFHWRSFESFVCFFLSLLNRRRTASLLWFLSRQSSCRTLADSNQSRKHNEMDFRSRLILCYVFINNCR